MSVKNTMLAIPLQLVNSAGLAVGYTTANSVIINHSVSILRINNASTQAVTISYDGTTDHEYLANGQVLQVEAQTNSLPNAVCCNFKNGTQIFFKGGAGVGNLAVSGYYQPLGA